jgi:polyketide cyclase/dehydrase/lipid transport protein
VDYSDSIDIAAPSEAAFELVSDLPGMGRFSPENTGGEWLGGARKPAVGVRFKGANAQGSRTWTTTSRVVEFDPPSRFAFAVTVMGVKVATWTYRIAPTDTGCTVTESWHDQRSGFFKRVAKTVENRDDYTKESIRTTLEAIKAFLEAT